MSFAGEIYWKDRSVGAQWSALQLTVPPPLKRAGLCVEVASGHRLRIRLPDGPRLWAQIEPYAQGLHWTRAPSTVAILPPISWPTVRRIAPSNHPAWARHYARALRDGHLLEAGQWIITPTWSPGEDPRRRAPPIYNLLNALNPSNHGYVDWGLNGAADVLALRDPSFPDAARVKAWRKHAEVGTLPPILLAWITGLDCHVVLDGHDRLQAAAQAGVVPTAFTLIRERCSPWSYEAWQTRIIEKYERARANGASSATLNALQDRILDAFDPQNDWQYKTRAWPLAGGVDAWRRSRPTDHFGPGK